MQSKTISELTINDILEKFKREITEIYQNELIQLILYGSRARGDAKIDSDIDILIVLKKPSPNKYKYQKVIDLISNLCLEYELLISCVYVSENQFQNEKSPLLINIHREGIKL
jgi:predicted nucleotidyltransferase